MRIASVVLGFEITRTDWSSLPATDVTLNVILWSFFVRAEACLVIDMLWLRLSLRDWESLFAVLYPKFVLSVTAMYFAESDAPTFSAVECFDSESFDIAMSVLSATPSSL